MNERNLTPEKARQELYEIIRRDLTFEEKAREVLQLGVTYLRADNGHLTRIDRQTNHWEAIVSTDPPDGRFPEGLELDLETTYCRRTIEASAQIALHDAPNQGWDDDPAFETHGLHCYHGTPLLVENERYGTLCFVAEAPRPNEFSDGEMMFTELIARMLERELERAQHEADLTRQANLATVLNRVLRHNLRNDMAIIRGYTQLMADRLEDNPHSKAALRNIDKLITLSQKARELDRVVAADFEREPTAIVALLERIVEATADEYPEASLSVEANGEITVPVLPSFEQALEELISNAAKHGGEAPTVTVTVEAVPNAVEIHITDDGPGLARHEAEVLETGTETPLTHGTGLGLWTAHWIITGHDGTIEATTTDRGTTMLISVPRTPGTNVHRQLTQLKRARDQYQAAFEEACDAMVIINNDARIIDANPEASNIYGLSSEALLGRAIPEFLPEEYDFEAAWEAFKSAGAERDTVTVEGVDGIDRLIEYAATADIVPGQHLVIARDISERVERDRALEATSQRLETIIDVCPDPIVAVDASGTIQVWNPAAEEVFGYAADDVLGTSILSLGLLTNEQRSEFETRLRRALDGEQCRGVEVQRQTSEGNVISLSVSTAPIRDASGDVTGVVAVAPEITEHVEAISPEGE